MRAGLGLIETVRVRNGAAPLWGLHVARVMASCRAVGVEPPGALPTPEGGNDRVVRLLVTSSGVAVSERPVGSLVPVRLAVSTVPHRPYPHKTTARDAFERAQRDAQAAGADDGILLVPGGWVAETAIWGLFWWEGDRLCAPPLELGILPGVARRRIDELVGGVVERRATPAELGGRALLVANAARGVIPVATLGGNAVPGAPETARLAATFWP